MAPDEIILLERLKTSPDIPYIRYLAYTKSMNQKTLTYKLTGLELELNLTARTIDTHINNLISLNILKDNYGTWRANDDIYVPLVKFYSDVKERHEEQLKNGKYENMEKIDHEKSYYSLTTLGETFIDACAK